MTVVNVRMKVAGVSGFEPELQGFGDPPTAVVLHPCTDRSMAQAPYPVRLWLAAPPGVEPGLSGFKIRRLTDRPRGSKEAAKKVAGRAGADPASSV